MLCVPPIKAQKMMWHLLWGKPVIGKTTSQHRSVVEKDKVNVNTEKEIVSLRLIN